MSKRDYLTKDERRLAILGAAFLIAKRHGLKSLSRDSVAKVAGAANGTVSYCFGNMDGLRSAVITKAIAVVKSDDKRLDKYSSLRLIAEGIICGIDTALNAPKLLRTQALNSLK